MMVDKHRRFVIYKIPTNFSYIIICEVSWYIMHYTLNAPNTNIVKIVDCLLRIKPLYLPLIFLFLVIFKIRIILIQNLY
jgi:hypothetical protein